MANVTDYRVILRDHLNQRCKSNPRYSLRAFARDLNVSCARLSLVMNGKKGLSVVAAQDIANRLGFSDRDRSLFCDLVQSQHARSQAAKDIALTRLKSKQADLESYAIQMDTFKVISDWYHFGILNLMHLATFQSNHAWIAKALQISEKEVDEALDRLIRLSLVAKENGKYKVLQDFVSAPDGIPSEAIRKFHKQILEKAISAMDTQSIDERDYTTLVLPLNKTVLPQVRERIRKFRDEICMEFTNDEQNFDSVYSLSVQFIKVGQSV